jgi:hypothetical protein
MMTEDFVPYNIANTAQARKAHLSISQLNMLSKCGEQYRRRYILGEKLPPGIALLVGSAVDKSVTHNLGNKLAGGGLLTAEEVTDLAAQAFNLQWDQAGEVRLDDDEVVIGLKAAKGQGKDKSVRLARLHAVQMAPAIEPTHLQRKVEVELSGYPYDILGYIDIQEGAKAIRDTKTSAKSPAADMADKDDQLTIYAMMAKVIDGVIPERLYLDYLIDTATPKAKAFPTIRSEEDFNPILRRIEAAALALEKGVFVPARESDWWCNPKWCGFHATCAYVKRGKRLAA